MINKLFIIIVCFELSIVAGCQSQRSVSDTILGDDSLYVSENTIAFSRLTGGYWQIWTMKEDGSNAKQITTSPSDKRYPVWTGNESQLLFRTNDSHAFSLNMDTNQERRIFQDMGLIGGIAYFPDRDQILVVKFRTQLRDSSNLWLMTSRDGDKSMLTRGTGLQYDPAWSPDGKKVVYVLGHGYQTHELYVMDIRDKNNQGITHNRALEVQPVFSPDGETIAYSSDVTGDFEIWLMNIDGTNCRQITDSYGIDTRPCWSPDGREIMFVSNRSGELQIWIMNSDGSNPRQLTTGASSMDPVWRSK